MGEVKPMIVETGEALFHLQKQRLPGTELLRYRAVWRAKQLLILPIDCHPFRQSVSAVFEGERSHLLTCLQRSPVKRLLLSPQLEVAELSLWVELAAESGLPVYLRLTRGRHFPIYPRVLLGVKRLFELVVAVLLLILVSPLLLVISLGLFFLTGNVFSRERIVGRRGRLFTAIRFSIPEPDTSILKAFRIFIKRSNLNTFPLLLNVIRGEIALWGEQLITLTEVENLDLLMSKRKYGLPGVWRRKPDIEDVAQLDKNMVS